MRVRNFWIEADIDGRMTKLAGGPVSEDGGFTMRICQRNVDSDGRVEVRVPFEIVGMLNSQGSLVTTVYHRPGGTVARPIAHEFTRRS